MSSADSSYADSSADTDMADMNYSDQTVDVEDEAMVEDENESSEGDDEAEAGPSDTLPIKLSREEMATLTNGKSQWMSCKGAARQKVFTTLTGELRKL